MPSSLPERDSITEAVRMIGATWGSASNLVATRGLLPASLLGIVEDFVASPQPLFAIERELSKGDPILVRAAVYGFRGLLPYLRVTEYVKIRPVTVKGNEAVAVPRARSHIFLNAIRSSAHVYVSRLDRSV